MDICHSGYLSEWIIVRVDICLDGQWIIVTVDICLGVYSSRGYNVSVDNCHSGYLSQWTFDSWIYVGWINVSCMIDI